MLYPLGLQESIKPGSFHDTSSMVVVLLPLQCLIQVLEDECPEASSRAKTMYVLCDVG